MPTLDDAIRKLQQGRFREGQRILERLLERNPSDPEILYNLGRTLYEASRDEGLTDWEVASRWVERLGVGEWSRWVGFEDMPESYFGD